MKAPARSPTDPTRERVRIERDGDVALWTIDRPEVRNAFDFPTFDALSAAVGHAARDRTLRAIVLTGAGATFVSGGDLRELRTSNTRAGGRRLADRGRQVCDGLARLRVPVIAALPGPAIGGGAEIALACDLRVADPRAKLSFKHARMGVPTAFGLLPKLVAMVGPGVAARLLLTGHDVDAHEAHRIGLVEAVCAEGASVATAMAWARDASEGAPGAVGALKRMLREAIDAPYSRRRATERAEFVAAWAGPDHGEAVEAFFERRPPAWAAGRSPSRPKR